MKKKEINFNNIFSTIPLPCLILEPNANAFTIIAANDLYLQFVGSAREDLLGKSNLQAFPNNPLQEENAMLILNRSYQKVVETAQNDSLDLLRYDIPDRSTGEFIEKYWIPENLPIMGEDEKVEYVMHTVKDVTKRMLAEKKERKIQQQLAKKQQQHNHFVDNNPDGLYSLDTNGNFLSTNEGLANIAELPIPELLKMSFLPFCHPEDQEMVLDHFHRVIAGETVKFEARFISAKDRHMILEIHLVPMLLNNKIEGAHGIAKDLTQVRESQKVIVEKKNFLKANAAFISALLENELEDTSLEEAFAIIGKTVAVDRMYYFDAYTKPESGETFISQRIEWASERATPQIDNPDLQNMPAAQVQQMMGTLGRNEPFIAVLSELYEGELLNIFLEEDIKSMLLLPIFFKKTLYGFIGFDDCTRERQWSHDEITFLQSLSHNLTTALEKRSTQEALRKQEEALIQSEKKFRALVQEGSDLIGILDSSGNYRFVSETSTRILGIPPEEFLGKNAFEFMHPEDKPYFIKLFTGLAVGEQTKIGPFRFRDQKNDWRWIETIATNLSNDPAVQGVVTNSRDITTVLAQAKEIEHINERYRLAATATQDLMYDWNLITDKVVRFHKTASFLGYSIDEVNLRSFWRTHIHPDELDWLHQHLKATLGNPEKTFIYTKYRMRRENGTYAHFMDRAYIIRNAEGKPTRMVGATSDISNLTEKEHALQISNTRFKMATEASNEMIWDWNITDDEVARSKAFASIYGYSPDDNQSMADFWLTKILEAEKEQVKSSLTAALQDPSKNNWRAEYRFIKANGQIAHVVDRGQILRDNTGKAIRMVGAVLDVTASRQAIQRIEAQNKRLKEIAWEQSHVVRAPLARLKALLPLLKNEEFDTLSHQEIWHHIDTSANELDDIIKSIVTKTEDIESIW